MKKVIRSDTTSHDPWYDGYHVLEVDETGFEDPQPYWYATYDKAKDYCEMFQDYYEKRGKHLKIEAIRDRYSEE